MNYIKYIILLIFVTSCSNFNLKIENKDIEYTIKLIQTNPKSWNTVVSDTTISQLSDFFKNEENIEIIVNFYEHIKLSKFNVINIQNRFEPNTNKQLCDVVLARDGNEFNITFQFKYFENSNKWKLINLQSKSLLLEKLKN